jgi:Kef-type K+ transport system membrane component KefB/mannitol/fructose-specific phosphotransferase system IIA component (Ntr-type)
MSGMTHTDVVTLLAALGVLIGVGRLLGEAARRLGQPAVIGELFAGIVLGPTIFGALWPRGFDSLFPHEGPAHVAIHGMTTVAVTLFLLVAGMEVDLSTIWRRRRVALSVGTGGMLGPISLITIPAILIPTSMDAGPEATELTFLLFMWTAVAISALPVVARILIDLQLFKTDIGMTIIGASVFNDLVGRLLFALVLAFMGPAHGGGMHFSQSLPLAAVFMLTMLTIGRVAVDRSLGWLVTNATPTGGVLGFAATGALLCAALTEWLGVHAIFGAFIFGIALGDSRNLSAASRETLDRFVSFIFAPIFFASIGLRVDFLANFDVWLVLLVLVVSTIGKIGGCIVASRMVGFGGRDAWAVAFGLNARGAMEIVLGLVALDAGLIGERMFVALVVMALVTSVTSGPLIKLAVGRSVRKTRFWELAGPDRFVPAIKAADRDHAITELAALAALAPSAGIEAARIVAAALAREHLVSSAIGNSVAVPHARIEGLGEPIVVIGCAPHGMDFNARDGQPVRLVILLVTPLENAEIQLRLLASVAHACQNAALVERLISAPDWGAFAAILNESA